MDKVINDVFPFCNVCQTVQIYNQHRKTAAYHNHMALRIHIIVQ